MNIASIPPKKRARLPIGIGNIPTLLIGKIISFLPNSVSCICQHFKFASLIEYKFLLLNSPYAKIKIFGL
jgi:hypothetical protein